MTNRVADVFGRQQQFVEEQQREVNPFYRGLMEGGLPYFPALTDQAAGLNARAFQPVKAQLEQRLRQGGNALPSGFAEGARSDLAAQQGRAFDQNLQGALGANLQAREAGASGLLGQAQIANPAAYSGQALSGYQSIMNAPLARPGLAGMLGGMAGTLMSPMAF